MIYTGAKAKKIFEKNIDCKIDKISGYFKDSNCWIAYDNTSTEMFVEEFKKEKDAIAWVSGFDISFDNQIKVRKILPSLYYVSKNILLKITIKDEIMTNKIIYLPHICEKKYSFKLICFSSHI